MRNTMKILVTGANGQLGYKIKELLSQKYELVLTDASEMDITNKERVDEVISKEKPDFIIHAAAYTQVDKAEENIELCENINILGTKNIAEAAKEYNSTLIYISTDFVFDGLKGSAYSEEDKANPLSVYGRTKFQGEKIVGEICNKYYIIRIAWLFGELPEGYPGSNFVETMLRLAKEKEYLTIVNDQIGSPTYTKDLVEAFDKMIGDKSVSYGTYHFSGVGACSWYDFASEIMNQSEIKIEVKPVTSREFVQKATRPSYSYLDKTKIEKALDIKVRTWQEMLGEYIQNRNR